MIRGGSEKEADLLFRRQISRLVSDYKIRLRRQEVRDQSSFADVNETDGCVEERVVR